jgi:hypothetical protein
LQRIVIVTVIAMRMMQPSVDEVIDMVSMGHRLMAAIRTMLVCRVVSFRRTLTLAAIGVLRCYFDDVLVDAIAFNMLEMSMIEIIDVIGVLNRGMATAWPVNMHVAGRRHDNPFLA